MQLHNKNKISIRPELPNVVINDNMTSDEKFQNGTLRPILKMQHDLVIAMTKEYIKVKKNTFYNLKKEERAGYIKNNLLADRMIVHELRGLVIGQFTSQEVEYYLENKSAINGRIQSFLFQRIESANL